MGRIEANRIVAVVASVQDTREFFTAVEFQRDAMNRFTLAIYHDVGITAVMRLEWPGPATGAAVTSGDPFLEVGHAATAAKLGHTARFGKGLYEFNLIVNAGLQVRGL